VVPYDPGRPSEIEIEFTRTDALKGYRHKPGVELISERVLRSQAESWWTAWRQFFF